MKVYCKDCKWFYHEMYMDIPVGRVCCAPTGKTIVDYVDGDYPEKINKKPDEEGYPNSRTDNGCKLYKRRWWKFWV